METINVASLEYKEGVISGETLMKRRVLDVAYKMKNKYNDDVGFTEASNLFGGFIEKVEKLEITETTGNLEEGK